MQFVLPSPSVRGRQALPCVRARRGARYVGHSQILKAIYRCCLHPSSNRKQLKAFCFIFYCLFSQWRVSHHIRYFFFFPSCAGFSLP